MVNDVDLEELAWVCLGYSPTEADEIMAENNDPEEEFRWDLDDALEKKFGCVFAGFSKLIEVILPMTPIEVSPINRHKFHALIVDGNAIVKTEADV